MVMQHFSMNLALEARLRSLDEDSGLGHEQEVDMEMEADMEDDLEDTIQFGHLSLDSNNSGADPSVLASSCDSGVSKDDVIRKKVSFGLAPPSQSRLAQRRFKTLSLDATACIH